MVDDLVVMLQIDSLLFGFIILRMLDFVTGFLKAYKVEGFKSRKIRDGLVMFLGELVGILFGGVLDMLIGVNGLLISSIKWLFIYTEAVSILENLTVLGIKMPDVVKNNLEVFRTKSEGKKE